MDKIDRATIEQLPVGKHWFSGKVAGKEAPQGFGVRVAPGGARSYVLRYTVGGKERLQRIGRTTDLSAADAMRRRPRLSALKRPPLRRLTAPATAPGVPRAPRP